MAVIQLGMYRLLHIPPKSLSVTGCFCNHSSGDITLAADFYFALLHVAVVCLCDGTIVPQAAHC